MDRLTRDDFVKTKFSRNVERMYLKERTGQGCTVVKVCTPVLEKLYLPSSML